MYLILQQDAPDDYVIATGITTEVREFVRMAFAELGVEIEFRGQNENEKGFVAKCSNPEFQLEIGKNVVSVDKRYYRPTEVELLIGDATKARTKLNWNPKYDLPALVKDMVQNDLKLMRKEKYLRDGGYKTMNYFE
jgi:GDPmannose 4,6-dehydratase